MDILNQKILIIIPAYNEESTIGGVIADIKKEASFADIVVVNDGSRDRTGEVVKNSGVKLLAHPFNMGIGATMQTGYKYALMNDYDMAVQVDADGQHPAREIKKLTLPLVNKEVNFVVGSRFLSAASYKPGFMRGAGIAFFSKIVSMIIKSRITDATSGFRAADKKVIEFLSRYYPDDYPEVEALVLIHKKGFDIMEVPVIMEQRKGGTSSITGGKSVYYMAKVILAIFVDLLKKVD